MFLTAFVSATILPMGSEAMLIYYINEEFNIVLLFIVATIGNSFGSIVNYYIGYKGEKYLEDKKYLNTHQLEKYKKVFDKYGGASILLSWLPIVGDPLTIIAGAMRYNIKKFIILVFVAKSSRYFVVISIFLNT